MMPTQLDDLQEDPWDVQWPIDIRREHQRLLDDEETLHNRDLHRRILATWERASPQMWARLQKLNLTEPLAYVLQERMWQTRDAYLKGGMPVTDAREQAEREHLLLEPEETEPPAPRTNPDAETALPPEIIKAIFNR